MPTPAMEDQLWRTLESRLGYAVPNPVREFCRLRNYVALSFKRPEERSALLGSMEQVIRDLARAGLWPAQTDDELFVAEPKGQRGKADGRWTLWRDLVSAARERAGLTDQQSWQPLYFRVVTNVNRTFVDADIIEVSFDSRLSLDSIVSELRGNWQELRDRGWVRRTRPLGDRKLALVRFICLEAEPGWSWRKRMEIWNERHHQWRVKDSRAFEAEFRTGSYQLTGNRWALEWAFDLIRLPAPEKMKQDMLALESADEEAFNKSYLYPGLKALHVGFFVWLDTEEGKRITGGLLDRGLDSQQVQKGSLDYFVLNRWIKGPTSATTTGPGQKIMAEGELDGERVELRAVYGYLDEPEGDEA